MALKGRVAAEISTTEELILTELLFEGVLGDLNPAEAVALLSALVFQVCGVGVTNDALGLLILV